MKRIEYTPQGGVCAKKMLIEMDGSVIRSVRVEGGCHGHTQAVSLLMPGMEAAEAIKRLQHIDCKGRGTSCPDQLAHALKQVVES